MTTTWDEFEPELYHEDNYKKMLPEDREIAILTRNYFREMLSHDEPRHGIDVGSGANLYPALSLLPWCETLILWEYGAQNVEWLRKEVQSYSPGWDPFVGIVASDVQDPRASLAQRTGVMQGSLFELPTASWDVGTMFFVAESITDQEEEFKRAVASFLRCLMPGAPFVAAFMTGSTGYDVGEHTFPAVNVSIPYIVRTITSLGATGTVHAIKSDLRPGHGMALVTGRTEAS